MISKQKSPLERERERERESNSAFDLFSFQNLLQAYLQCRKSKRKSKSAVSFEFSFEKELLKMEEELRSKTYQTGKYSCFAVVEPKIREIWAADFRDRILHHLLISRLEPTWERKFIFHSYACRPGKGAHLAIKNLKKIIRNNPAFFFLQIDIESFFMNIDKKILFSLLQKNCSHPHLLWLAKIIIFQDPTKNFILKGDQSLLRSVPPQKSLFCVPLGKGLPIGNYTSQFFANVYLNELDQFVKHRLKCHFYLRYMDDLLLLNQDPKQLLFWRNEISSFLEKKLLLKLHPKKQLLQPVRHGINFLGYIIKPEYSLNRQRVVSRLKRKLHRFNKIIDPKISPLPEQTTFFQTTLFPSLANKKIEKVVLEAQACVNSYFGHFNHSSSKKLKKSLYFKHFKQLKNFLEPVDENFSHFVLTPSFKKSIFSNKKDRRSDLFSDGMPGRNTARNR